MYKGILCNMAAFTSHCTFGVLHPSLREPLRSKPGADAAMGTFGRITDVSELPSDASIRVIVRKAMALNEAGKTPMSGRQNKTTAALVVPHALSAALKKNRKAAATFKGLSHSKKKEYVDWLLSAKTDDTREKRLTTTLEWLAEGKERNWKYAR